MAVPLVHILGADVLGTPVPVVVGVVAVGRAEPAEQVAEVLQEPLLELVHADDAGRVRRVDAGDAVFHLALPDDLGDLVGDVAHGEPAHRPKMRLALKDLHSVSSSPRCPADIVTIRSARVIPRIWQRALSGRAFTLASALVAHSTYFATVAQVTPVVLLTLLIENRVF